MNTPTKNKSIEEEYGIKDPEGKPFEIPVKGSMGLLALGYRGLMAWRAKRIEANDNQQQEIKDAGDK